MTNSEKIVVEAIKNGVYTPDEVKKYLAKGEVLPIHTAFVWKQLGYHIMKGEHARINTKLWRMVPESEDGANDEEKAPQFYLADAHLFTSDQVEREEARLEVRT